MLFNSLTFVVFFVLVVGLYRLIPSWTGQKGLLLVASYLFYAAWNPPFVLLLFLSTAIDWFVARALWREERPGMRRALLLLSLSTNLGLLGFFKYSGFALDNVASALQIAGLNWQPAQWGIVLPVGISFYTFQTLSYTIDVYRRVLKPSRSLLDFALYVTFFPQLVAGPIVRAKEFLPQCLAPKRPTANQFGWGLYFITLGLFQKSVLADGFLAPAADTVFGWTKGPAATLDAWVGLLGFSGQIFFDFAGYSTCAIGAALCLGFILPDNFRSPYAAIGFSDFWKRWHITLSSWLRDYLYIPLGGNRRGSLAAVRNLLLVMFLGGLWHGASWTFVAWGVLHGLYLVAEHALRGVTIGKALQQSFLGREALSLLTFLLITLAWVFFRAPDFGSAATLFQSLFHLQQGGAAILPTLHIVQVTVVITGLLVTHRVLREMRLEHAMERLPAWFAVTIWTVMLVGLVLMQGGGHAFIYFQF